MCINQKGFVKVIFLTVIIAVIITVVIVGYFMIVNKLRPDAGQLTSTPLPESESSTVKIKLIDAFSTKIVANADLKIVKYPIDQIYCLTENGCPSRTEWLGKSDEDGFIEVPSGFINLSADSYYSTMYIDGYDTFVDFFQALEKNNDNNYFLEINPEDQEQNGKDHLKVIDLQTQKPIKNVVIFITTNPNCHIPQCNDFVFSGITNDLGNIYYPFSILLDTKNKNGPTGIDGYVVANGYKVGKIMHSDYPYSLPKKAILEKE